MRAPEHICRDLERVHQWARLGWYGSDADGRFALLDLYPAPLAARTLELRWDDMGPVYGSDYDRLARVPIVKGWFTPKEVFGGYVIPALRRMLTPLVDRVRKANEQHARDRKSERKDLAGQMGEELYWKAQRSSTPGPTIADKHITKEEKARVNGDWEASVPDDEPALPSALGVT